MDVLSSKVSRRLLVALLHLSIWLGAFLLITNLQSSWQLQGPHGPYPWVGMDFAPYWVGAREALHGHSPYRPATLYQIQEVVYGGPAGLEDPMMFMYPGWIIVLVAPFTVFPYPLAATVYIATLLWAVLLILAALVPTPWQDRRSFFWLAVLLVGSLPFLVISVTKGQLGYWSLIALFMAHRSWQRRRDFLAGVFLALALLKPTTILLPTFGFLFFALHRKRWALLKGFAITLATLLSLSILVAGYWVPDYLHVLRAKGGQPVLWSLTILPFPWNVLWGGYFLGLLAITIFRAFHGHKERWFASFILAGMALTPIRWIYDLFIGVLLLAEYKPSSSWRDALVSIAVLAPWLGIFIPPPWRWHTLLVGLPLIWSIATQAAILPTSIFTPPTSSKNAIP